ncbi:4Fe-4S dicluster domain-containing protein [Desulfothermus sp.]
MRDLSFSSGGISVNLLSSYPEKVKNLPFPEKITLPLKQDMSPQLSSIVKKKAKIAAGDIIATGPDGSLISPVSGEIVNVIKDFKSHLGGKCAAIEILVNDIEFSVDFPTDTGFLHNVIKGGIVDIQDRVLFLAKKIEMAQKNKVDTLIVNGLEEIIANGKSYFFLQKQINVIKQGFEQVINFFKPNKIFLAIYSDYRHIDGFVDQLNSSLAPLGIKIVFLKKKYPQHKIPLLVKTILNEELEMDKPIEESLHTTILDLETIYHLGLLINNKVPYREKIVTVIDGDISNSQLVKVPIGTPIHYILEKLNIDTKSISKVIINGTISGIPIYDINYPITKDIGSIFVLKKGQVNTYSDAVCIKCGLCVEVCPMGLMPLFIFGYSKTKQFDFTKKFYIEKCIECGCCAYVCPVNIPLVQWIKYGKANLNIK